MISTPVFATTAAKHRFPACQSKLCSSSACLLASKGCAWSSRHAESLQPACSSHVGISMHWRPLQVPLIGWIGRLDYQKGPDVALDAVPGLAARGCQVSGACTQASNARRSGNPLQS